MDLLARVAALEKTAVGVEPDAWYRERYGRAPSYSDLIAILAPTSTERQQLLRGYFEPTEDERNRGLRQPTVAHRAVARLVARGSVRVILTTNFDRLLETALADAGVAPSVIASGDQMRGALPLQHSACTLFKLHGDYLDTRIRNTEAELDVFARYVVHPELSEKNGVATHPFGPEETPDEASS